MARDIDEDDIVDAVRERLKKDKELRQNLKQAIKQKERGLFAEILIIIIRQCFGKRMAKIAEAVIDKVVSWFWD